MAPFHFIGVVGSALSFASSISIKKEGIRSGSEREREAFDQRRVRDSKRTHHKSFEELPSNETNFLHMLVSFFSCFGKKTLDGVGGRLVTVEWTKQMDSHWQHKSVKIAF